MVKKNKPSTPMPFSDVNRMSHFAERNYSVKRNKSELLFNAPNYPMNFIKKDANGLEKESKLKERREISCDKIEREKACKLARKRK